MSASITRETDHSLWVGPDHVQQVVRQLAIRRDNACFTANMVGLEHVQVVRLGGTTFVVAVTLERGHLEECPDRHGDRGRNCQITNVDYYHAAHPCRVIRCIRHLGPPCKMLTVGGVSPTAFADTPARFERWLRRRVLEEFGVGVNRRLRDVLDRQARIVRVVLRAVNHQQPRSDPLQIVNG